MSRKNKNMTEEELRDYEYEDMYEIKQKRKKIIGIVIIVVVLLLKIFLCLRSCMSGTTVVEVSENEKNLLEAGKEYFNKNYEDARVIFCLYIGYLFVLIFLGAIALVFSLMFYIF